MARIKVKHFGPVKSGLQEDGGWIDIKKVTVFIGNQGSGKSTVAKLFSTLSWIEKAMVKGQINQESLSTYNRFLKQLQYQRIDHYIKPETEIVYKGRAFEFHFNKGVFKARKVSGNGYILPKIMYISAERNFLSVVDRPEKLKNLPSPLFTFLEEYDSARNLYSKGVRLPIGDAWFEFDVLNNVAHIAGKEYKLRLSEASSGFQSTVPLYLVTRYLAESLQRENDPSVKTHSIEEQRKLAREIERIMNDVGLSEEVKQETLRQLSARYKPSCFLNIVEEPEQNLFPASQQKLLNSLLEYANQHSGNKLIITTHSPFLIFYLSIAIQGDILKRHILKSKSSEKFLEKLEQIVPVQSTLDADDVIVYQMDEKSGTIHKLPNPFGIPSDENFLNQSIREGNILFDRLLEIEEAL